MRQGHAAADAVERAVQSALPEADVVVHVEPEEAVGAVRERAHAAALGVPRVREVHNVTAVALATGTELSLHLKLPADLSLAEAHAIAEEVEHAIRDEVPEVSSVQTHLEPLTEEAAGTAAHDVARRTSSSSGSSARRPASRRASSASSTPTRGSSRTSRSRSTARRRSARRTRARAGSRSAIRAERPEIGDVIVHTEP